MKIGITGSINFNNNESFRTRESQFAQRTLIKCLLSNNVTPIIFPIAKPEMAKELAESVDGIIFTGGADVLPKYYHEDPIEKIGLTYEPRDEFEIALLKVAKELHKPILGICRGMQIINVALGGSLYQDLNLQYKPANKELLHHSQSTIGYSPVHYVNVKKDSALIKVMGEHPFVNSFHHEAVKDVAKELHITATANDGVIEGLENHDASIQCVQWHPENMWDHYADEAKLFKTFFKRVKNSIERK
ncbi:gamma-glutamyl-gamma-aminobutyrate hydrolase family protein [Apilactobacillus sp. M161]|uniref:Gamma-glutamyl-gamma-aminobutyrate hydrolase family protein n=1 Tax=Apilactobacillus xinyiensis TaxID=2841032 RepID=A0ABT0I2H8_9LACO|nr:gamma-glutamyl-gamma-aminobutyrate hydrolase family protein [Apilactobacillus xinyiensis]MCK8624913.1 gamma-glutamyl-gamma-aminobutyrate hydrolase family protein [Apilactobacillus xinyiensis]